MVLGCSWQSPNKDEMPSKLAQEYTQRHWQTCQTYPMVIKAKQQREEKDQHRKGTTDADHTRQTDMMYPAQHGTNKGARSDLYHATEMCKEQGTKTIAINNNKHSDQPNTLRYTVYAWNSPNSATAQQISQYFYAFQTPGSRPA